MERYREGERTQLPYRVTRQLVAARYGQTPMSVDRWPAADFLDALATLGITTSVTVVGGGKP